MTPKVSTVNKTGLQMVLVTLLTAAAFAPNAFAGESVWTERTVTAKISMAELQTETGLKGAYAKLEKKAERFCRADRSSLYKTKETVTECVGDLMNQFVESSKIESLQAYHSSMTISDA